MAARSQNMDKLREEQERAESEDKKRKVSLLSNEEFLKAFDVDLVEGQEDYMAMCPAHNDGNTPALSIKLCEHKRLLHCFAGCTSDKEGVLEVLSAARLEERDLYINEVQVAEYIYENEKGYEVFKKVRMEPKGFKWRQKSGNYWVGKITKPWVIYKLPEVKYALYHKRTIFFCEGEKDADKMIKLGFDATTMGAAITGDRDKRLKALDPLAGADVVIVPDADKAGGLQTRVVSKWLQNHKCRVRIIALPEHDISDWLDKGHTKEELETIVADTPYEKDVMKYLNARYEMCQMGAKAVAIDKQSLARGEIAAFSRNSFMEADGGLEITIMVPVKDTFVEMDVAAGPEWWKHKIALGMKIPVFRPSGKINPNEFNLFPGWAVQPTETGSCELFKKHLLENVCRGNQAHFKFLWDIFADLFQHPENKPGVAVALRSDYEGTGKSIVGVVLEGLLGASYYLLGDAGMLETGFNLWMANKLLLHMEESFFSGSHRVKSYLKHIITDKRIHINPKGLPSFILDNFARVFVSSNSDWVAPVGKYDRRWYVLDVSNAHKNDRPYFKAMLAELEAGGYGRLLWELLTTEITSDFSQIPETEAKRQQIIAGDPFMQWLEDSAENYHGDMFQLLHPGVTSVMDAHEMLLTWAKKHISFDFKCSIKKFSMEMVKLGLKKTRDENKAYLTFDPKEWWMVDGGLNSGQKDKEKDDDATLSVEKERQNASTIDHPPSLTQDERFEMEYWLNTPNQDPMIEPYQKKLLDILMQKGWSQPLCREIHKLMEKAKSRNAVLAGRN
jgi:hypothetical protein